MNVTMPKLILLLFFLLGYCYGQLTNPPANPCPAVFQYVWVSGEYQGQITIIPPLKFSQIKLQVKMTVTYFPLVAGVGRIDFKRGVQEIQEISDRVSRKERQQITFIVVFPPGQPTPRIAQVVVNGKELCPNQLKSPDTRGEINLSYILNTGLPYSTHDLDNFLPAGQEDSFNNGGVQDNVGNHGFLQIPTSNHHVQKPNQQFPSFVQPVPETPQSLPAFVQPVPETPQSLPAFVQPDPEPIQPLPVHVQTIPELTQPILSQPEPVKPVPGIEQSLPYWTIPDHTPTALPKINEPQQTSSSVFKEAPTRTSQAYMHKTRLPEVQAQTEISQYDDTSELQSYADQHPLPVSESLPSLGYQHQLPLSQSLQCHTMPRPDVLCRLRCDQLSDNLESTVQRRDSIKCIFSIIPLPSDQDIQQWINNTLQLPKDLVYAIEIDRELSIVIIKINDPIIVESLISTKNNSAYFTNGDGETSTVMLTYAGFGYRTVRVFHLPTEVPDQVIRHKLMLYGSVYNITDELWGNSYLYNVKNGVRSVFMYLQRHIGAVIVIAEYKAVIDYEGQPKACNCNNNQTLKSVCVLKNRSGVSTERAPPSVKHRIEESKLEYRFRESATVDYT